MDILLSVFYTCVMLYSVYFCIFDLAVSASISTLEEFIIEIKLSQEKMVTNSYSIIF